MIASALLVLVVLMAGAFWNSPNALRWLMAHLGSRADALEAYRKQRLKLFERYAKRFGVITPRSEPATRLTFFRKEVRHEG